jgi:hypothetical protein
VRSRTEVWTEVAKPDHNPPEADADPKALGPPAPVAPPESLLTRMRALTDRLNPRPAPALVPPVAAPSAAPPTPLEHQPEPELVAEPLSRPASVMNIALAFEQKRKEVRNRCLRSAKVVFHDRRFQVDCQVRDESASGMKLRLLGDVAVPDRFELLIESREELVPVQVRWRRGMELGVLITGAPAPLPPRLIMDTSRRR